MTDADSSLLRGLIEQWRDAVAFEVENGNMQYAQGLDQAADQLSVVLSSLQEEEE